MVRQKPGIQNYIRDVVRNRQGDAIVVWRTWDIRREPLRDFIHAQRFDSRNEPVGGVVTLRSAGRPAELGTARLAMDDRGRSVVAWDEKPRDNDTFRLFFQRYGANGEKRGNKRLLTRDRPDYVGTVALAAEPSGEFVAVWVSREGENRERRIKARWFDPFGRPLSSEVPVTGVGAFITPAVDRDRFGNTVIVWAIAEGGGQQRLAAKVFDRLGEPLGNAFGIGAGGGGSVGFDDDGNFVVAWRWQDPARPNRLFSAFQRFRLTCVPGYEQRCP